MEETKEVTTEEIRQICLDQLKIKLQTGTNEVRDIIRVFEILTEFGE